jgi:hypothetical protein
MELKIFDRDTDHVVVASDGPARFEITVVEGRLELFGYTGTKPDLDQEPTIVYDGHESASMVDIRST